jgi:putative spermidine/putrescine transport system ATP-binding protein
MSAPTHLEIRNLTKRFGAVDALADVDLTIARGEFVCLLGPSGCGKTTLLRIIAGFEKADRGQLLLEGKDITELAPHQRGFGMVFQSLALFPHMTVAENIGYGMKLRGAAAATRRRRVEELLEVVQLPAIADRPVAALSGGQRQRVAIARALAGDPACVLADEPTGNLDRETAHGVFALMLELARQRGMAFVMVSHDETLANRCDRVLRLKHGRLVG